MDAIGTGRVPGKETLILPVLSGKCNLVEVLGLLLLENFRHVNE